MAKKRQYVPSAYKIKEPERLDFYTQLVRSISGRKNGKEAMHDYLYYNYVYGYNTGEYIVPKKEPFIPKLLFENCIKELTKKRLITQKKYSWVTDGNIMSYISSENEELFLIGYTILEHKNVFKI